MHTLLRRQLKHVGLAQGSPPAADAWVAFLERVDRTYQEADQDRYTLEHSLELVSVEMQELYDEQERSSAAEIRRANQFLDSIIESIPDIVFVKDAASQALVHVNRAAEEILGLSHDELGGKPGHDLADAGSDAEVLAKRAPVTNAEVTIETKHRGPRILSVKKLPICDVEGTPRYILGISRDVTEAKRAEAELYAAKDAAERASRTASDFLANMSHELRTPLNAVLGFARVLQNPDHGPLSDRQRSYVHNLVRAAEHMLALVNDLLDLRRLDSTHSGLVIAPLELRPVVEESVGLVRSIVDERRHALTITVPADLPLVRADRRAVVQILVNLLGNAAKFTPPGGAIVVRAGREHGQVAVEVQDNGVGIAPEQQSRLFTYYEQLGAKHGLGMKGSGIGLALTKALVEKLGGTIRVRSEPGRGTVLHFTLPIAYTSGQMARITRHPLPRSSPPEEAKR